MKGKGRSPLLVASLAAALLLAAVLFVAAWAKFFHPAEGMPGWWRMFHFAVALFEVVFALLLLSCHRKWQLWAFSALLLASWAGYSLFWLCRNLPCGCMGKMLDLPTGATFSFDLFFLVISVLLASYLHRFSWWLIGAALAAGGAGYLLALFLARVI